MNLFKIIDEDKVVLLQHIIHVRVWNQPYSKQSDSALRLKVIHDRQLAVLLEIIMNLFKIIDEDKVVLLQHIIHVRMWNQPYSKQSKSLSN